MDETIRVRIVADTQAANTSLKKLGQDTKNLAKGADASNVAIEAVNRSLHSVGLNGIKINSLLNIFDNLSKKIKNVSDSIDKAKVSFKNVFSGIKASSNKAAEDVRKVFQELADIEFSGSSPKARSGKLTQQLYDYTAELSAGKEDINDVILELKGTLKELGESTFKYTERAGLQKGQSPYRRLSKDLREVEKAAKLAEKGGVGSLQRLDKAIRTFEARTANLAVGKPFAKIKLDNDESIANENNFGFLKAINKIKKKVRDAFDGLRSTIKAGIEKATRPFTIGGNIKNVFEVLGSQIKKGAESLGNLITKVLDTTFNIIKKTLKVGLIGGVVAVIVGGIAAIKNVFSVAKLGNEIDKTSQKVGMSTTTYQKWSYILERCGVEAANLKTAMRGLTAASMSSQNSDYFKQLGINPDELSQEQLFEKTVEALQKVEDSTTRAQMAYKLFGRASAELAPVLALNSAEIQRLSYQYDLLGATMDGRVVKASVNLTDALQDMRAAWQGLKNTLAQALMPLITNIVVKITVLIAKINMIIQTLFGVDIEYSNVVERTQAVKKNTEATTTAVKKLKTLIAGFDELNIFPSQDNPNGDIGSFLDDLDDYGSDILPSFGEMLPEWAIKDLENFRDNVLPGIVEKIKEWKETWEKLKEAYNEGDLGGIFKILGEQFDSPFLTGLGDAIDWVIDKVHALEEALGGAKLFGWEMPDSLQEFLGFTEDWDIDWEHLFGLDFDYENSPLGKLNAWLLNIMDEADKIVINTWNKIKQWFTQNVAPRFTLEYWKQKFKPIKDAWEQGGWLGVLQLVWGNIKQWFSQNVAPKFTLSYWQTKFNSIKTAISNTPFYQTVSGVWNSIKGWWNSSVAPKFTSAYWKTKFETIKTGLGNVPIVGKVKETWNSVKEWWNKNIAPKFTVGYWKEKFNIIPNGLGYASILTKMREKWAEVKSWWDKNVSPKFTWTYWRDKFNSIKSGLENISLVQAAKNMINGLINTLESGLNRIIDKLNGSGILSALRTVGVNVWLNRVYIPRLAKGGIIDEPTMAMMGEYPGARNNPEIVTPERKLTQIFENSNDDIVGVLVQGFRQIISAIDDKDLSVSLGDTQIAKSAARGNNQYRLQTGTSLF